MSDYSFYELAYYTLNQEISKLEGFIADMDRFPLEKADNMFEYRNAEKIHGGMVVIYQKLCECKKTGLNFPEHYWLVDQIYNLIKDDEMFLKAYYKASEDRKSDTALYYGIVRFAEHLIEENESSEKIKDSQYTAGYRYAVECLKDVYTKFIN